MTLILKLDLDVVKMYLYTEDEVPSYSILKVIAWTDTQTHRQTDLSEIITYPHADGNKHVTLHHCYLERPCQFACLQSRLNRLSQARVQHNLQSPQTAASITSSQFPVSLISFPQKMKMAL